MVNLGFNKPATQSSTRASLTADKAVDGDYNTYINTANDQHPSWWKIDLQEKYTTVMIKVSEVISK